MNRNKQLQEARMEVALRAAERWAQREPERASRETALARGGPAAAEPPERAHAFIARERARALVEALSGSGPGLLERMIGPTLDWAGSPPDGPAYMAGRPVARIVEIPDAGMLPQGFGTGFLVHPGLLLTNHHVLPGAGAALGVGANFLHDETERGVQQGQIFELDPDAFFETDAGLDFTLVAVRARGLGGEALGALGHLPLVEAQGKILRGHPVSIIQHPGGGPKKYATTQNQLLDILETGFLHYTTDTMPGSSGSAAFNRHWEVVALHHAGVPHVVNGRVMTRDSRVWDPKTMGDDEVHWIANEGVRASAIVRHLRTLRPAKPEAAAQLAALLNATDPLEAAAPGAAPGAPSFAGAAVPVAPALPVQIHVAGNAVIHVGPGAPALPAAAPVPAVASAALPPSPAAPPEAREASIRFDRRYTQRRGYDPGFLGGDVPEVPLPTVSQARFPEMLKEEGDVRVLRYHHFSLAMNRVRRLVMWSAVNVDYRPEMRDGRSRDDFGRDRWIPDPRIPGEAQIQDDDFYRPATRVDRGHIVRREDNVWGETPIEREYANSDTFHWTNCTPQHEAFNQEKEDGVWGQLEARIKEQLAGAGDRASIFAGPVLADGDPVQAYDHGEIRYPLRFWKVVAVREENGGAPALRAYGFLLDQSDVVDRFGLEGLDFGSLRRLQVPLARIVAETGVELPDVLLAADVMAGEVDAVLIRTLDDVRGAHPAVA